MKRFALLSVLAPVLSLAQAAAPQQQPALWESFLPFAVMLGFLYFVMIRPQMRKQKEHQSFVTALKSGDEIITQTGILGTIRGLTDTFVTLEIADGVRIKMLRSQIAGSAQSAVQAAQKESTKK